MSEKKPPPKKELTLEPQKKQSLTPKKKGYTLPTTGKLYHKGVPAKITWLVFCGFFRKEYLYINSQGKIIKRTKLSIGFNNLKAVIKTFLPWYLSKNKDISRARLNLLIESLIVAPWPTHQRGQLFRLVSRYFLQRPGPNRTSYNFVVDQHRIGNINYLAQPARFLDAVYPISKKWEYWIRGFEIGIEQEAPEVPYEVAFAVAHSVSPDQDDEPLQIIQSEEEFRGNRRQRLLNLIGPRIAHILPWFAGAGMALNELRAMKSDPLLITMGAVMVGATAFSTWRTWNWAWKKKPPNDPDPDPDEDPNEIKWEKEVKPKPQPEEFSLDQEELYKEEQQQDPEKKFDKDIKYVKETMEKQTIHPTWLRKT